MSGKYSTKELLDGYFKTRPDTTTAKIRGQIDRDELYEYEKKINKQLVEMDAIEIAQLLKTFNNQTCTSKTYKMSYRTYDALLSILRDFFNWYIDNYEIIKNPCNDKRIKGRNAMEMFVEENESIFTKESLEKLIEDIRNNQVEEYADYAEAIIRMTYEGFAKPLEIVELKETDINHEKKTVMIKGREIQLSDRLYELLVKIHAMTELPAYRGSYSLISYHDSYFKFPTREKFIGEVQDRSPEYWGGYISRILNREIKNKLDVNINARTIYLLGFYDYLLERVGEKETNRLIKSLRSSEDTKKLMGYAGEYGVVEQNVTTLKKILLPFVK